MIVTDASCGNPQCKIAETGKCVEGLQRTECSHYGRVVQFTQVPETGNLSNVSSEVGIKLPVADPLSLQGASGVLKSLDSVLIAIVGGENAGKTSLLAGLYELFQDGPIGSFWFGGSKTMHAFERACHDARTASKRTTPYAERTGLGPVQFYHLIVRDTSNERMQNLLLADRGGEMYEDAIDDIANADEFVEIDRASKIILLVDGIELLEYRTRHEAISKTVMLAKVMKDSRLLHPQVSIAVVLTKFDEIAHSASWGEVMSCFESLFAKLHKLLITDVHDISSFQTAASPRRQGFKAGFGVPELLKYWMGEEFPVSDRYDVPSAAKALRVIDMYRNVA